jgi:hypothetical protein
VCAQSVLALTLTLESEVAASEGGIFESRLSLLLDDKRYVKGSELFSTDFKRPLLPKECMPFYLIDSSNFSWFSVLCCTPKDRFYKKKFQFLVINGEMQTQAMDKGYTKGFEYFSDELIFRGFCYSMEMLPQHFHTRVWACEGVVLA